MQANYSLLCKDIVQTFINIRDKTIKEVHLTYLNLHVKREFPNNSRIVAIIWIMKGFKLILLD